MLKYIAFRIAQLLIALLGLSMLIFVLARVVPGDPARIALGLLATKEQVEKLREEMHLDDPVPLQYLYWFQSVLKGDLGKSWYTHRPVTEDLRAFLPATFELILFAFLISLVLGQTIGVLAGYFRFSWFDNLSRFLSYVGVATPPFAVAVILLLFVSYVLQQTAPLGRLSLTVPYPPRVTGLLVIDSLLAGQPAVALDALRHLLLPAFSLALANLAQESRITRSSIIENLQRDYVSAHRVYGVSTIALLFKYLLKPSLIPTISVIGLDFAFLMSNAFLVEVIFRWPGFSNYAITVMLNKDLNAIVAVVLVIGIIFALVNLLVDLIVAALDPRIRLQRRWG